MFFLRELGGVVVWDGSELVQWGRAEAVPVTHTRAHGLGCFLAIVC